MHEPNDLLWIDFETRAAVDIRTAGAFRYATDPDTRAIVLAYAIGEGRATTWHADGAMLDWDLAPADLRAAFESGMTVAAWNMFFDKAIWNYATLGFPLLEANRVIDVMVQAMASNLPADLEGASTRLGGTGKQKDGKALIKLFSVEAADPALHPEEWQRYLAYGRRDIDAMREVYRRTRPLPLREWTEYRAMEASNQRGIGVDVMFASRAAALAAEDRRATGKRLDELTGGGVKAITQAARLAGWLHRILPDAEARAILEIVDMEEEADEAVNCAAKLTLRRSQLAELIAFLLTKRERTGLTAVEEKALEAATLREFGGGAAPAKFARLAAQQVNGVIRGQYVFNGAQTGRAASRGIQIHNLVRDTLGPAESTTIDVISDGCSHAELAGLEPADIPVARKLALLVRPALIAAPGNVFAWSDWSAIEARVLPWLADSEGSQEILCDFVAADTNPALPDLYVRTAAGIFGKMPAGIDSVERQQGKIATLACGFGGGRRALQSMAANYRIHFTDDEADAIVFRWRAANRWAVDFWGRHDDIGSFGLWGAAMTAWENPGLVTEAGRIKCLFEPLYLDGTLFLELPSSRLLSYPGLKWRTVAVTDDKGRETGDWREEVSFRRAHGRVRFYRSIAIENCIAAGTPILTKRGWLSIEAVKAADLLWDGVEWVEHGGLLSQGNQRCITFQGVSMTPRHKVLTDDGWAAAETRPRPARRGLWLPDGTPLYRYDDAAAPLRAMGMPLRLRSDSHTHRHCAASHGQGWLQPFVRSLQAAAGWRDQANTRNVQASGIHGLVLDAGALPRSQPPGVEELRRAGDSGLPGMGGFIRSILAGYEVDVAAGPPARPDQQRRQLREGKLSLGSEATERQQQAHDASSQHAAPGKTNTHSTADALHPLVSRPVYDIRNAGPRSRFMVLGNDGPFVVSNCTQAVAADLLRGVLVRLEENDALAWMQVRGHTHDEVLVECREDRADEARGVLRRVMLEGFAWSKGLPLAAQETANFYYTKHKVA